MQHNIVHIVQLVLAFFLKTHKITFNILYWRNRSNAWDCVIQGIGFWYNTWSKKQVIGHDHHLHHLHPRTQLGWQQQAWCVVVSFMVPPWLAQKPPRGLVKHMLLGVWRWIMEAGPWCPLLLLLCHCSLTLLSSHHELSSLLHHNLPPCCF